MRRKITPQHKLFHPKPVLMLITHTAGCISCHPPPLACAVYFHSSVVHIGYCLWCMILKRDRLRRDRRQSRQLTEQASKQIQVIFLLTLGDTHLPEHNKGTFILYLCHHWSVRNIDDPGQKLACLSKQNSANAVIFSAFSAALAASHHVTRKCDWTSTKPWHAGSLSV